MIELLEILFSFGSWLESMGMAREHVLPFIVGVSILVFAPIMVIMKLKTYRRDKGLFEFITRQQSYLISLQDEETITKEQAKIIFKKFIESEKRNIERFFFKSFKSQELNSVFSNFFTNSWNDILNQLVSFKVEGSKLSDYWKSTRNEYDSIKKNLLEVAIMRDEDDIPDGEEVYHFLKNRFGTIESFFSLWLEDGYTFQERKNFDNKK